MFHSVSTAQTSFDPPKENPNYETMPARFWSHYQRRPKSPKQLHSTGRKHLMKEYITDQLERFHLKSSRANPIYDLPLGVLPGLTLNGEGAERRLLERKPRVRNLTRPFFVRDYNLRAVTLTSLPHDVSLADIVSLVRGGQLDKVIEGDVPERFVQLHFFYRTSAEEFFRYAKCGLYSINGKRPIVKWLPFEIAMRCPVQEYVMEAVNKSHATRVIRMTASDTVHASADYSRRHVQDAASLFAKGYDVGQIRTEMSQFGKVIEIKPYITNTWTITVHFSSVSELVIAMKSLTLLSLCHLHKYKWWKLQYDKDPADVPCYMV